MPSIPSLIEKLTRDFPDIRFVKAESFEWSPETQTISYSPHEALATQHILHELAHAILGHKSYERDVQLLQMEREAWTHAKELLGPAYDVAIDTTIREKALDSYRDWLHARSTCPNCTATGLETDKHSYSCPACRHTWRVNEARLCGLKRYSIQK